MSNLQEKTNKEYPLYDVPNSVSRTDEYDGNEIQFIKRSAFKNGYEQCQKEYEEQFRWIPVSEFDFDKFGSEFVLLKNSQNAIPVVRQVLTKDDLQDYVLFRLIEF